MHTSTLATVVRAGDTTTLVSLSDWYRGLILAPVETWVITAATGRALRDLPGTQLLVQARLGAVLADGLALKDWHMYSPETGLSQKRRAA